MTDKEWDRLGNAHAANGLILKARAAWRVADAIRSIRATAATRKEQA